MKKYILFALVFFPYSFLIAQSLVVTGDTVYNGDVNTFFQTIEHHLDIENVSGNAIEVACQKTVILLPQGLPSWGGANYCFAKQCYQVSSTATSDTITLNSQQLISYPHPDAFTGYYSAEGVNGIAIVRYCFYDVNNPADETCLSITYDVTGTISSTNIISRAPMNFYPNPTNEYTTLNYRLDKNYRFELIDVLGNNVKDINLNNSGQEYVYVGDLSKGIYFGNLVHNNKLISTKKLIVR